LPLFFGTLIVVMLGIFIWAMSRAVEGALVRAGHNRALVGADQVAGMVERPIASRREENARFQSDTALKSALRNPTAQTLEAARRVLLPSSTPVLRRAELWDARGSLVLEIVTAPPDSASGLRAYPRGARPTGPKVSGMQAAGKLNFFDLVLEIREDASRGGELLGYLRRFGRLSSSPGDPIKRLLGDSAMVKIGSADGLWTDFSTIVDPPPALEGSPDAGGYRSPDGTRWIGAAVPIDGSPWTAWVGFPRTMMVAPAQPFMRQMLALALLFIVGGVAMALLLGVRLTQPLHAMAHAAEQIAAGDYTRRVTTGRRDEIGRLGAAFNTMTDRIEHAHTALKKSHEQTHFALAAARIGIWEIDLATGNMLCSASMHLLHRLPGGSLPETCDDFVDLLHKDDREAVRRVLQGNTPGHDEFDIQYRANGPGGSLHWNEGKGRLIRDGAGNAVSVLGVSIDVTDRNRLESQFRQAQKMEAIGQLAGGVAHDFNNLLTAIIGHAELLLMDMDAKAEPRADVNEILKAADSAAQLTRQLLTFSRHQVMQPDVIDANVVIRDTKQLLTRLIGERITLVTDLASDLDPVKVDGAQLQQVLMNLVVNSRDAMPQGGTLSIASANTDLDEDYAAEHTTVTPGRHVLISVSDTGMGMDAATQARLFEPFFTTKALGKGTGLGLATVYGIVKQSGGHIYVYSEPGHGTTFKIYLPSATESITTARKELAPAPRIASGGETILVVDDNEPVRIVAQTILERMGYQVLTVGSGQEALQTLERTQPRPHLILTDVILPGMTGPELYREVSALYSDIRVIFTSGYSPDAIAPHTELQRGVLFVEKPYNASKLASTVREALGREVPAGS
jgi:signal transduction histidine kinase/ActR/RegA family two-component response regulator